MSKLKEITKQLNWLIFSVKEKVIRGLAIMLCFALTPVRVWGKSGGGDEEDIFTYLQTGDGNSAIDGMTTEIKKTGKSIYDLIFTVAVILLICSIVMTGAAIVAFKSPNKREENKGHLIWIGIGCVVIFGGISIATFGQSFASTLFTAGKE